MHETVAVEPVVTAHTGALEAGGAVGVIVAVEPRRDGSLDCADRGGAFDGVGEKQAVEVRRRGHL
jgi:hypothetical protein